MSSQQNKNKRFFGGSVRFYRNASLFFGIFVPMIICFICGTLFRNVLPAPPFDVWRANLRLYLNTPFAGCTSLSEGALRILLYASPRLILSAVLLLASILGRGNRALRIIASAVSLVQGYRYSVLTAFLTETESMSASVLSCSLFLTTEVLLTLLLCIYAYRLALCISLGFPSRHPMPGTLRRLISFTARTVLWIFLLILFRIGVILLLR